jgi:hypothetical protein
MPPKHAGKEEFPKFSSIYLPREEPGRSIASIGSELRHGDKVFDRSIFPDWYRQQPEDVAQLLRETGFELCATTARENGSPDTAAGHILASKPT